MSKKELRAVIVLPVAIMLISDLAFGRRKPRGDDKAGPAARLGEAPPKARLMKNPMAGKPNSAAAGHKLFEEHCAECHGNDARGLGRAANLHSLGVQNSPPGAIYWALRNGRIRHGMPSWSQLPDQEIWQLVTFIKSLDRVKGEPQVQERR